MQAQFGWIWVCLCSLYIWQSELPIISFFVMFTSENVQKFENMKTEKWNYLLFTLSDVQGMRLRCIRWRLLDLGHQITSSPFAKVSDGFGILRIQIGPFRWASANLFYSPEINILLKNCRKFYVMHFKTCNNSSRTSIPWMFPFH